MSNAVSFHPTEETILNVDQPQTDPDGSSRDLQSMFTMKVRQSKTNMSDSEGHEVVFNVTFSLAIPGVFANTKSGESFSTRNSSIDPLRMGNQYFHLEFDLFSKEINKDPFKTDVIFCGTFAKIYPDKADSKVIPTWSDGEDTWICWVQKFTFRVNLQHIQSLSKHTMRVTVWDTKDKCLPKVRFDHPKPPKSSNKSKSVSDTTNWIKETIMMISHNFSDTASFHEFPDRILPHQILSSKVHKKPTETDFQRIKSAKSNTTSKSSATSPDLTVKEKETLIICSEPKDDTDINLGSYIQLEKLLESKPSNTFKNEIKSEVETKKFVDTSSARLRESVNTARPESRKSAMLLPEMEKYHSLGRVCIDIHTADLFLSNHTISRSAASVNSLEDMFCMLKIDGDILSPTQKKDLNPLIITVKKVQNVPNKNNDFSEINRLFLPIHCEYQFCDSEPHRTVSRTHNRNVRFDDVNVILTGLLSKLKVKEQIQNSFLTVKLFDRLERPVTEITDKSDFKSLEADGIDMGDVNITSSLQTVTKVSSYKPRGEAKIDLSDLITKGLKYLELMVPIVPTSENIVRQEMTINKKSSKDNENSYLDCGTSLKVSVKLAHRLDLTIETTNQKVYNRLVVISHDNRCNFIRKELAVTILKHNCRCLNFHSEAINEMQTFLFSTSKTLTDNDSMYTGAFLMDKKYEILILECNQESIRKFYELCSSKLDHFQNEFSSTLKLLYNESLSSNEKGNFQILTMFPLQLSRDIDFFVSQPLLYVRDMLPRECVEGICKIKELVGIDSMHIVLRNKLIPSNQMIESISQYLCSHITDDNENGNKECTQTKEQKMVQRIDRKDIKTAPTGDRKKVTQPLARCKTQLSDQYVYPKQDCAFSYSCQTLNSISSAKQVIREKIDPNRRYTYSQDYLFSGSFDPVELDDIYAANEKMIKSEPRWLNKTDVPKIDTLPQSRKDDLQTQWIANTLHKSFMEPTLPERDQTTFKFDLYIRPLKILNRDSNSIMPSYFEQKQINKANKMAANETWQRKVCVSDTMFRCHRVLPVTEMTDRGALSSNQIAKLQGLRKDKSTLKQKYDANKVPATYVIETSPEVNRSYTVGSVDDRNLLVNYVPVIERDKHFNAVYNESKHTFLYKNTVNNHDAKLTSPFTVYC